MPRGSANTERRAIWTRLLACAEMGTDCGEKPPARDSHNGSSTQACGCRSSNAVAEVVWDVGFEATTRDQASSVGEV